MITGERQKKKGFSTITMIWQLKEENIEQEAKKAALAIKYYEYLEMLHHERTKRS